MKYYREEYLRHPEAKLSILTLPEMKEATKLLCRHFGVDDLPVYFTGQRAPGKRAFRRLGTSFLKLIRTSDLKEHPQFIYYAQDMLNAKVVAHEVAHYVLAVRDFREIPAGTPRPRAHDHRHVKMVDKAIQVLRANGYCHPVNAQFREVHLPLIRQGVLLKGSPVTTFKMMSDPVARNEFYKNLDPLTTPPHIMAVAIASRDF